MLILMLFEPLSLPSPSTYNALYVPRYEYSWSLLLTFGVPLGSDIPEPSNTN